ncbi:hypothetical protein D6C86_05146 [Aureobasidium pullulans]|nr:hypothetical protein D6D23_09851 [Aureobasidium pullulans]THZ60332.1 hypothetical protein D6C86_05146 [Aureobasidium pullulans]THZ86122.1 hypothetical protein D6C88_05448 [Aureobasidium pullulans]
MEEAFVPAGRLHDGFDGGMSTLLFVPCATFALLSISEGLGVRDYRLKPDQIITATMYFSFFDLLYVLTLGVLKYSLCLTLLRFATAKTMRQTIYIMIIFNTLMTVACIVGIMALCRPYRTNWRHFYDFPGYPKKGSCSSGVVIKSLAYSLTAIIFTSDVICVILPATIFWKTRMQRKKKIMAWMLLSLGLLASVATLGRLPFLSYWSAEHDRVSSDAQPGGLGIVTLCCSIEIALGIFAGCAPAIRPLVIALFVGIRSQTCSGELELESTSESIPAARPTRARDPYPLTSFTFNTIDLKTIHSPRGDVVDITSSYGMA